ncbi:MAG: hypothetical protein N3B16_05000 [Candidatus Aminicenantes bacterium]|nr:hypothetical protein [Candidatus Aminicenantes bacterium]
MTKIFGLKKGKANSKIASLWPTPFLLYNFFVLCALFQIYLISQAPFLYYILEGLFFLELVTLFAAFVQLSRQKKILLLAFALIVAIRIPFYLQGNGLIFHSDNALEALQPLEIQDSHRAPFFLLNSSGHNGTLKYLCVAFIWDILGKSYTTFVLFQLLIFLVFIYLFYEIFSRLVTKPAINLLVLAHFAFIEVIFDYSLFLRAAPYLEMLTVFLLGVYLFDFNFSNKRKLFLAFYFLLFSSYLHPLIVFLIVPFGLVTIVYSWLKSRFKLNLLALLAGGGLATYHLLYYKFFWPPPPPSGEWYRIVFFSPAQFSLNQVPLYLKNIWRDLWTCFHNLFDFEFLYSLQFFQATGTEITLLKILNRIAIFLSLGVGLLSLFICIEKIIGQFKARKISFEEEKSIKVPFWSSLKDLPWVYLFIPLAFLIFIFKAFILMPRPYYEPRHNIDLALWLSFGFAIVLGSFFEAKIIRLQAKWLSPLIVVFLLGLALPHYIFYLKIAIFKKDSYAQLIPVLRENKIRYLATDFSLAYPIYFLTNRKVKVTDSFGPVTVPFFYYWLREEVDKIPWPKKAYLFFGDNYWRRTWHLIATFDLKRKLIERLKKENIPYRVVNLPYYTIIIPRPAIDPRGP